MKPKKDKSPCGLLKLSTATFASSSNINSDSLGVNESAFMVPNAHTNFTIHKSRIYVAFQHTESWLPPTHMVYSRLPSHI